MEIFQNRLYLGFNISRAFTLAGKKAVIQITGNNRDWIKQLSSLNFLVLGSYPKLFLLYN